MAGFFDNVLPHERFVLKEEDLPSVKIRFIKSETKEETPSVKDDESFISAGSLLKLARETGWGEPKGLSGLASFLWSSSDILHDLLEESLIVSHHDTMSRISFSWMDGDFSPSGFVPPFVRLKDLVSGGVGGACFEVSVELRKMKTTSKKKPLNVVSAFEHLFFLVSGERLSPRRTRMDIKRLVPQKGGVLAFEMDILDATKKEWMCYLLDDVSLFNLSNRYPWISKLPSSVSASLLHSTGQFSEIVGGGRGWSFSPFFREDERSTVLFPIMTYSVSSKSQEDIEKMVASVFGDGRVPELRRLQADRLVWRGKDVDVLGCEWFDSMDARKEAKMLEGSIVSDRKKSRRQSI